MPCLPPKRTPDAQRPEYGLKVGAFRPHRRWAVDNVGAEGYADKLPPDARVPRRLYRHPTQGQSKSRVSSARGASTIRTARASGTVTMWVR